MVPGYRYMTVLECRVHSGDCIRRGTVRSLRSPRELLATGSRRVRATSSARRAHGVDDGVVRGPLVGGHDNRARCSFQQPWGGEVEWRQAPVYLAAEICAGIAAALVYVAMTRTPEVPATAPAAAAPSPSEAVR